MVLSRNMLLLLLLLLSLLLGSCHAEEYDGYSRLKPGDPYAALYDQFYTNLRKAHPCVLTGNVFGYQNVRGWVGCAPPLNAIKSMLYPITPAAAAQLSAECTAGLSNSSLRQMIPSSVGSVILAFAPYESEVPKAHVYNLNCVLRHVLMLPSGAVVGVLLHMDLTDTSAMGAPIPQRAFSPYGSASWAWNTVNASNFMWNLLNMTIIALPRTQGAISEDTDWQQVRKASFYNKAKQNGIDNEFPQYVTQTNFGMYMARRLYPPEKRLSCLSEPSPTCLPIGGQSVWGSSNTEQPSQRPNPPPDRIQDIAVIVSSSSTAYFHDLVPAADGAGSGIVSMMLIADAFASSGILRDFVRANQGRSPNLYFFAFYAEDYGLTGSGRFVKELQSFNCTFRANNTNLACTFPLYQLANFTSVNITSFRHVIQIEQVGIGGALFYHVDSAQSATSVAQQRINQLFEDNGATRSSTPQLPPNSIFSFLQDPSFRATLDNRSLTTISAYNTQYPPQFQSPQDVAANVNLTNVVRSAQLVMDVIRELLQESAVENHIAYVFPRPVVNTSLASLLWACVGVDRGACDVWSDELNAPSTGGEPNFYPGVFQFYSNTAYHQTLIRNFLVDRLKSDEDVWTVPKCSCPLWALCQKGRCVRAHAFYHHAFSPSLEYVNAPPIYFNQSNATLMSGEVWVESFWSGDMGARVMMVDSDRHNYLVLASGMVTAALCVLLGLFVSFVVVPKLKQP